MGSFNPYGNGQPNGMNDLFDEEDEDYIEFKRKMQSLHPTLSWGPNPSIIERIFYNSARLLPTGDTYGFKTRKLGDAKNKQSEWKAIKCSLDYYSAVSALKYVHLAQNGGKEFNVSFNQRDIVQYETVSAFSNFFNKVINYELEALKEEMSNSMDDGGDDSNGTDSDVNSIFDGTDGKFTNKPYAQNNAMMTKFASLSPEGQLIDTFQNISAKHIRTKNALERRDIFKCF